MEEHAQSKGRILLVDHDEEWLNSARSVLVTLGYSVEIARSITEALDLPDMYDLVLMNWAQADQERLLFRRLAQPDLLALLAWWSCFRSRGSQKECGQFSKPVRLIA